MELLESGARQLCLPQQLVGGENAVDLLPGGRHHLRELALHDLCAHAAGGTVARVEVEIVDPAGHGAIDALHGGVPAPVDGGSDDRIGGERIGGIVRHGGRHVDESLDGGLKIRCLGGIEPRGRLRTGALQRAFEPQRRAGGGNARLGVGDVHGARTHAVVEDARCEGPDEGLEVAGVAGGELEAVVAGQQQGCGRGGGPGGLRLREGGDVLAETVLAPVVEGGHEEDGVGGLGIEPARTEQARDDGAGRGGHGVGERVVAADLGVSPVPGLGEVGKNVDARNLDGGEHAGRRRHRFELVRLQGDQGDPGPQAVALGRGGGEEPGQVRRIELDAAEVVGLEVGGEVARLGADDVLENDAGDVAGAGDLDGLGGGFRNGCGGALQRRDGDLNAQGGAIGERSSFVGLGDGGGDAAAAPGKKVIVGDDRIAHAAASCRGRI